MPSWQAVGPRVGGGGCPAPKKRLCAKNSTRTTFFDVPATDFASAPDLQISHPKQQTSG